ncbi:MAG TPA: hypothetical protein VF631_09205 [Allosphingosinicella sp.]|jgi:hypothetical protein|uniref:hypothetical protein n=1 Tax=Allosphingosinicella sp. TaxID=2823234 RepID=UPI002F27C56D
MNLDSEQPSFDLIVAGRKIDNRTAEARRFRALGGELQMQLGRNPNAAERMMIMNAATLAMLCERDAADLLEGKKIDAESYRRNVTLLGSILVKLGMAMKSRDVTKRDRAGADDFGAALIEASAQRIN